MFAQFGRFHFELERRRLWLDGRNVALENRLVLVLDVLIREAIAIPGKPVEAIAILNHVWAKDHERKIASVHTCIKKLRQIIGQKAIQTHGWSGYSLPVTLTDKIQANPISGGDGALNGVFRYVTPAEEGDFVGIAELAARVYTGDDIILKETMLRWFRKNPTGFWVLLDERNRVVGNLNLLPLRPTSRAALVNGEKKEKDLTEDDLFAPVESGSIDSLHVESFVYARRMLSIRSRILKAICPSSQPSQVYALAGTDNGAEFMESLGFLVVTPREKRSDGHDMYGASFEGVMTGLANLDEKAG